MGPALSLSICDKAHGAGIKALLSEACLLGVAWPLQCAAAFKATAAELLLRLLPVGVTAVPHSSLAALPVDCSSCMHAQVSPGGMIYVDDYNSFTGCK